MTSTVCRICGYDAGENGEEMLRIHMSVEHSDVQLAPVPATQTVEPPPETFVHVESLTKHFPLKTGFFASIFSREEASVKAVDGITFGIKKGEIFGLAGESGSGKTTTGRLLVRLVQPTKGHVLFEGKDISKLSDRELKPLRRRIQIIFQDPYESLNPRMTIKEIVAEPIRVQHAAKTEEEVEQRVKEALQEVELVPPDEFLFRYPHDLAVSRHMCDRLGIMYLGQIVETGSTDAVIGSALHPYTQSLIAAVPVADPSSKRTGDVIAGEIPSPINPPSGCRFHTRCPYAHTICTTEEPHLIEVEKDHTVACHLYDGVSPSRPK